MSCFLINTFDEDNTTTILDTAQQLLDIGHDALGLAPIPGLDVAAGALSSIIGMIKQTRGNVQAKEQLANQIQDLAATLQQFREDANEAIDQSELSPKDRAKLKDGLSSSPELEKRVTELIKLLTEVKEDAGRLDKHGFFLRCLRSGADADALMNFQRRIKSATDLFKLGSQATVEKVVTEIRGHISRLESERVVRATLAEFKEKLTAEASYRSEHNSMKSHFFHGTRTSILDKLEAWAKGMDSQCPFYVLSGVAGAGKSTIAYEFARRLEQDKLLGATFFFVRGDEKLSTTSFLVPTLAYQLSQYQPDLLCRIVKGAQKHLDLGQRQSFEWQIDELIIDPLKDVPFNHSPMIIIIDAIDECTTSAQDDVARLLYLLLDRIRGLSCPLRILITTRPELHIENALNSCEFQDVIKPFKLHDIPRSTVDSDIYLYLEDRLKSFRYNKELVAECPRAIADLTARAESLFIYASTALNFLVTGADGPAFAVRRLNILLSNASGSTTFRSHLDNLYLTVLKNAFPKNILDDEDPNYEGWLRDILGVISLAQDHISLKTFESLLGIAVSDTLRILRRLGSLIIMSTENFGVQMRPLHASFPQFLIDKERCTAPMFLINPSLYHGRLALHCLQALTDPDTLAGARGGASLAPHLLYSCVHWPTHLASTDKPSQELLGLLDGVLRHNCLAHKSTIKRPL